jgi:peptidoglycan-associated lipoprotein
MRRFLLSVLTVALAASIVACGKKPPAVAGPHSTSPPFPGSVSAPPMPTPMPPPPVPPDPTISSGGAITSTSNDARSIDDINRNSPLKPAFFRFDSDAVDDQARKILSENAEVLKANSKWVITIEGHCDERGTAEYNLALGERRAVAVKTFLVALGISPDRVRTVSYGKEFPFDPGRTEEAMSRNRRGHFVITSN